MSQPMAALSMVSEDVPPSLEEHSLVFCFRGGGRVRLLQSAIESAIESVIAVHPLFALGCKQHLEVVA